MKVDYKAHEEFDNSLQPESWNIEISGRQNTSAISGKVLAEMKKTYDDIVVFTADVGWSTKLNEFGKEHPNSFFNFGISEQNMVTAAAGIATTGKKPYVGAFGSFLSLLCCEQIRTDIAYPNLPVRIIGTHSGMTFGFYGTSHHALEDLSILRPIANMTIICPADAVQLEAALWKTYHHEGPIYYRVGRGRDKQVYLDKDSSFTLGKANILREGDDLTVITNGLTLAAVVDAADMLRSENINVQVIDVHTVKPFDAETIADAIRKTKKVMTVEEHSIIGGIGSSVAEVIADYNLSCEFTRHGIYDEYVLIGPPLALYNYYQLDSEGVANKIKEFLKK